VIILAQVLVLYTLPMRVPLRPAHPNAKRQVMALLGAAYGNMIGKNACGTLIPRSYKLPGMVTEVLFRVQIDDRTN